MASFCLPFNSMLKNNIKHTYFGKPVNLEYREPTSLPTLEQIKRMEESQLQQEKLTRGKTAVYRNYEIPQAPAFNVVKDEDLDGIVERLRKSTVASTGIQGDSEEKCMSERREKHGKFMGLRKLSASESEALVSRLTSPTHASRIRAEKNPYVVITEINNKIPSDSIPVAQKLKEEEEKEN